ncbi:MULTISPECIES: isochorismatase family protein [Legionella]|uniref:YcaC related amidohydrolase n=1 Tax=Legionella maceachernii TaxID=466 RepID=A0A0W0VZX3_9GAMM|nr:isochorismatase family protein [Legionella maceachernii]KTD25238.1 YcaC related amidohydrolase [Legionella maceachernii]SJZ77076.1 Nicotinamidase-related amidase [Legionella maceachernii]SUP03061.1 Isochorismatase family [Legionella maceachernii]
MLLEKDRSCLLLIDVQEKLTPHVLHADAMVERCQWLIQLAAEFDVPLLVSEQYPKGLGPTVEPLRTLAPQDSFIDKIQFSCFRAPEFKPRLQSLNKKQMVLIGIEAHVCVLQTALDLQRVGYDVYVVVDAVSSRFELDYKYGLKRMKQNGVHLVTSEMVFFEWVGQAGTAQFKALSKVYLQ